MRIQVSTGLFREAAETVVARLVSAGFFSLQLSAAHRAADIPALARLKEEHGLEYTMHAPFPGSGAEHFDTRISNAKVEAQILASLENARQLDCPVVVMHAGYSHGDYDKEMAAIIASLHRCADAADKQGIGLCIENTDNAHTPAGVVRNVSVIEKLVKSGFRLCLDTSHLRTILASDSEVLDVVKRFLPSTRCIHLVDYEFGAAFVRDHLMPGMGSLDVARFIETTKDFKGYVVYEPYGCSLDEVVEYDRRFRAFAKGGSC